MYVPQEVSCPAQAAFARTQQELNACTVAGSYATRMQPSLKIAHAPRALLSPMHPAADCRSGLVQSRSTMVLAETVADWGLPMTARPVAKPTSQSGCRGKNSFGGMGATLVDSLDTLWLLGLKDAFHRARDWIASSLRFDMCAAAEIAHPTAGHCVGSAETRPGHV